MDFFGGGDWFNAGSILDFFNAQGAEDPNFKGMPVGTTALALAGAAHGGKSLYDAYNTGAVASGGSGGAAGGSQAGGAWGQGAGIGSTPITPSGAEMAGGGGAGGAGAGSALSKMSPLQLMQLGRMGTGMMNEGQQQVQPPGVVGPRQTRPITPFYSIGQQGQDMRGLLYCG